MSVDTIRQRISVINAETARLNNQRNQNIGKREALQKQLSDAFVLYEKTYGVKLTEDSLQSELDNVTKKKEEELKKIEQILGMINAGDIAGANKLAGVDDATHTVKEVTQSASDDLGVVSEFMQAKPPVSQGVYTGVPQVAEKTEILEPITTPSTINGGNTQVVEPVAPPVIEPVTNPVDIVVESIPPVSSPSVVIQAPPVIEPATPIAPPSQPKTPVLTGAESLDMGMSALEGFTKPTLGSIAPPPSVEPVAPPKTQVQDFGAILNGTAFKPQ